jgi:hypothetical protein
MGFCVCLARYDERFSHAAGTGVRAQASATAARQGRKLRVMPSRKLSVRQYMTHLSRRDDGNN